MRDEGRLSDIIQSKLDKEVERVNGKRKDCLRLNVSPVAFFANVGNTFSMLAPSYVYLNSHDEAGGMHLVYATG